MLHDPPQNEIMTMCPQKKKVISRTALHKMHLQYSWYSSNRHCGIGSAFTTPFISGWVWECNGIYILYIYSKGIDLKLPISLSQLWLGFKSSLVSSLSLGCPQPRNIFDAGSSLSYPPPFNVQWLLLTQAKFTSTIQRISRKQPWKSKCSPQCFMP